MRCPLCDVPMKVVERRGVEIDVCPECRGVWLDRGELDKLLNQEAQYHAQWQPYAEPAPPHGTYPHHPPRKKKSFLEEIFDIFD